MTKRFTTAYSVQIQSLKQALNSADAVVVGAGAGLYIPDAILVGKILEVCFKPLAGIGQSCRSRSRHIMVNRYQRAPKPVYDALLEFVEDKDYFVLTTNVDHQFQMAGFDKKRLFYTQGDYGLWQCSEPCHQNTYDNEEAVRRMLAEQRDMKVPSELVPRCPVCGKPMSMNLRADNTFVQDEGWYTAAARYSDFLHQHGHEAVLFLELGVGYNTPGIIKYPFWQMTAQNSKAAYACINYGEAACPEEIESKSICINYNIEQVLKDLLG